MWWALCVLLLYVGAVGFICVFSVAQLHMAWVALRLREEALLRGLSAKKIPFVSVQLPLYNEPFVVERLLRAVTSMDYPRDSWEIQVLDDSTDETSRIIESLLAELASRVNICHIRREERRGYKAGALAAALPTARGEVIAIFDADFVPPADFLLRTVPYLATFPRLGFLQCRWGHINERENLWTRLQAFGLNAHFFVEQCARNRKKYFTNFNGTAGLWRKECILESGGWQSDTLTEDLDLSYRAQLLGWRYLYLHQVVCPAELPTQMHHIKKQQYRWSKGAAQNAKKHVFRVLRSRNPWPKKWHALCHLLNSSVYPALFLASVLSVPLLYIKARYAQLEGVFFASSFLWGGFVGFLLFYAVMSYNSRPRDRALGYLIRHFFWFMAFSMGLSCSNTKAVLTGYLGYRSPFVRTPKQGLSKRVVPAVPLLVSDFLLEALLCLYFVLGLAYGISLGDYGMLFFHLCLVLGYGGVCGAQLARR